jgi:hypothetical protein
MLCQMNLLLHGLDAPQITKGNSLDVKIAEIGDDERVDVILTNPPFGGEEERGIQSGFPADKQTSETALLFLQLIMRKLRKTLFPGRAAVVVPNGTLFGDGVCGRIKQELLTQFNLHTVVRLPNGVFAPYLTCVPVAGVATARFVCFHLLTPEGLHHVGEASPGSADRNRTTNVKQLMEIPIPVPPYAAQLRFDALQAKLDALRALQSETAAELDALLPSVLNQAFAGKL